MEQLSRATPRWCSSKNSESGATLVELMLAAMLTVMLIGAIFSVVYVGMRANAYVSAQARYSQELSLAVNRILDGSGNGFEGLRTASSVTGRPGGGYEFRYSGPLSSHTEAYWIDDGYLYRSADGGQAEQVTRADTLRIQPVGTGNVYVVTLVTTVGAGKTFEYSAKVKLRNKAG